MAENLIAFFILAVALLLTGRWFYRSFNGKSKQCGCGEACPRSGICSQTRIGDREK
ncbi:MAG: hypothetical protein JW950_14215 [Deltaproteobacteria bacterium]|nr:hypothetical protein [Deltaproteobacteria bacterium]